MWRGITKIIADGSFGIVYDEAPFALEPQSTTVKWFIFSFPIILIFVPLLNFFFAFSEEGS